MEETLLVLSRLALLTLGVGGSLAIALVTIRQGGGRRWLPSTAACLILLQFVATDIGGLDTRAIELIGTTYFVAFPLLLATFPDGRFVPRWSVWLIVGSAVAVIADFATGRIWHESVWWTAFAALQTVLGVACIGYRYRRSATTRERESVRWLLLGVIMTIVAFMLILITDGTIGGRDPLTATKATVAILPLMAGLIIGITRPRIWNVDAAFWGVLVAVLSTAVLGGVAAAARILGAPEFVVVAAVGLPAYPVIRLAMRAATWLIYRSRLDPDEAVARLAASLDADDPRTVAQRVVDIASDATGSARTWMDAASAGDRGIFDAVKPGGLSTSEPSSEVESFPIVFHGEVLATLRAAPRAGESSLSDRDRRSLAALAQYAAPALDGARALREARSAQAALVTAAAEEQRRLRRELHDDLGPALSGLALSAAALARRAEASSPSLAPELAELHRDIQSIAERSREISHGLRPPVLDDRGLEAAIRDRIGGGDSPHIELTIGDTEALPAAIDLAALRIVQEAVTNVRRHAEASACRVRVEREGDVLALEIDDNGIGVPRTVQQGMGLRSIRERAAEVGGRARVTRGPDGGTSVRVWLPLAGTAAP